MTCRIALRCGMSMAGDGGLRSPQFSARRRRPSGDSQGRRRRPVGPLGLDALRSARYVYFPPSTSSGYGLTAVPPHQRSLEWIAVIAKWRGGKLGGALPGVAAEP